MKVENNAAGAPVYVPLATVTATPLSTAGAQTFGPFDCTHMGYAAIQATATGTPTGTLTIQASNDGVNYGTIIGVAAITVNAAGTQNLNLPNIGHKYLQAVYAGSGAGTLLVIFNAKGF